MIQNVYNVILHLLGVKQYALVMIGYISWYIIHDMIPSTIHMLFLAGKQRPVILACDQELCTPPANATCAVVRRSGYSNGGLVRVSRCSVLCRISFYWTILVVICQHLLFIYNYSKRYITASYCIIISLIILRYVSSAIYQCTGTMMNHFTPNIYSFPKCNIAMKHKTKS